MNYLIVGASSGLGRDLAYIFAKNSHNLTLISRDESAAPATGSSKRYHDRQTQIINKVFKN